MTYTPTAYTRHYAGKWWIFLQTPSGGLARLHTNYETQKLAEMGIQFLGFRLIDPPKQTDTTITFANLNRGNTKPR